MPFVCKFQLNNGAIGISEAIQFVSFNDNAFGKWHEGPVHIANVQVDSRLATVYSTCPSFPSTKGALQPGDTIDSETIIGYFATEGEHIPYDKPYARIEFT